jgi:hypothetical protein
MNTDASPGVSIQASATIPALGWASAASLTIGGLGLAVTVLVLVIRAASRR